MNHKQDGIELGDRSVVQVRGARDVDKHADRKFADHDDNDQLARLGKKAVLKRNFGYMSIIGFSCTVLITWEGTGMLFSTGLSNGGTAGLMYSFLVVWVGNISLLSTLSELVSMAPTSGGQYHWVAMLAPRSCAKFVSYLTGWFAAGGWLGSVCSAAYLAGSLIQGLIVLTMPTYESKSYQALLLLWAIVLFAVFINSVVSALLPKFEAMILILHLLGFFAVLIPLVTLAPHGRAETIFTTFQNLGNWPSMGVSFLVGMIGNVFAFVGADAAFHMAEEVNNPSVVVPKSLMLSLMINGASGFAMMIALLFCAGDIDQALQSSTGFPFLQIYLQATNSVAGSTIMASIIVVLCGSATVGVMASTSRVIWAFARDRGIPGWRILSKVDARTSLPLYSIAFTTVVICLLGLITLGSAVAFNDVISISVSGLYSSYLIAASLLLYRRCTSGFKMPDATRFPALANTTGAELVWGPWHIPGALGILNNAFACVYLLIVWFFSFWPVETPTTAGTMNFSVVVTGGVVILSITYYLVKAKRVYVGPIVETQWSRA